MRSATDSGTDLRVDRIRVGYAHTTVIDDLTVQIPDGGFTVIIGPNGCGKSTLLRTMGRMLPPRAGRIVLDGHDLASYRAREAARRIGLLPQSPAAPGAITVADLVSRGRFPYQTLMRQWSPQDELAVTTALAEVGLLDSADRLVEELSGGQRQRAWIAMALAQATPVLLLDEPTTSLDIAHQLDVLDLCSRLHRSGRTLVAVLHDLNLAARYATHVIAMRDGRVHAAGGPDQVFTSEVLRAVFDLDALVLADPETGRPMVVPRDRRPDSDPEPEPEPEPEPDREDPR